MTHNDIDNFSIRLRKQREKLGIRKHDLAESVGVSLTTIQQYESGQMPRGEFAVRLANVLDCSLDWLLAGRSSEQFCNEKVLQGTINIPIIHANSCLERDALDLSYTAQDYYIFYSDFLHARGNPANMVLFRVSGDSMSPNILNNDMVLIDQGQTKPMPGQMYAVSIQDMIYIKLVDAMPNKLLLSSLNEKYTTIELDITKQNTISILGRVIWLGRDLH